MISRRMKKSAAYLLLLVIASMLAVWQPVYAEQERTNSETKMGGAYAASGQLPGVGYTATLYDASNGLPTSDANYIMCSSDGYMWIGGYSGIIRYDGKVFNRLSTAEGLTSGRTVFEDSFGRIWVGTNDNGVVLIEDGNRTHITYKEGLPSSSVRNFAQGSDGLIYAGTASGLAYIDSALTVRLVEDSRIEGERILQLRADVLGKVYGLTKSGSVFAVEKGELTELYSSEDLGMDTLTSMLTDPDKPGVLYLGTETGTIYRGKAGKKASEMKKMKASGLISIGSMTYACGRLWASSMTNIGYFSLSGDFSVVEDIPVKSGIEMITSDYQGNIWLASSAQGIMKLVSSNFTDLTEEAGLDTGVVNTTCLYDGKLYVGTDSGVTVLEGGRKPVKTKLAEYIGDARVRCLYSDGKGSLWTCTYTNDLGLVKLSGDGDIRSFTVEDGLPSNEVRCAASAKDGSLLVGTNSGLAVIDDDEVIKSPARDPSIPETVVLTVCAGSDGETYIGTDGEGIYVIDEKKVTHIGRDEGLTSDVVMRIKWDRDNEAYWIVTSNSIQVMKDGELKVITSFPYNNNYDICLNGMFDMWIISSYGVFSVKTKDMLEDNVRDFRLYTLANGLTTTPTSNSYSAFSSGGNLYIAGRSGVSLMNLNNFSDDSVRVKMGVRQVTVGDKEIFSDADGKFTIPSSGGRIKISPAVLDYTLGNPVVHVYLEDSGDDGITDYMSDLDDLEFTGLSYGDHTLHVQVLDNSRENVIQEETFSIDKEPRLMEMPAVRILIVAVIALIAGLLVWRFLSRTIIRRQYQELQEARKTAERAEKAKTYFLASMSQELCDPIHTIMGMNDLILREDATGVPKPYHKTITSFASDIKNASGSLLGLVNEILDLSNIESGKMVITEEEYRTVEMLRSIVSMIRIRSMEKDLAFKADIDTAIPQRLYGDHEKIRQILLNLLSNAVKYTEEGGFTLTVSVTEKTEDRCSLRFSVKDTGAGIKEEDLDRIFTAYDSLEAEDENAIKGTGIGLDISRHFAGLMGGRLWCESEYGKGADFIFTVDQKIIDGTEAGDFLARDEEEEEKNYVPQFVAPDGEILVVDDNTMNLSVVKGLLKPTMMFVTTAESGEECLEKIKFEDFDLVLLDVVMPGMDGFETVARIREKHPDLPVYAMTAEMDKSEEYYRSRGFSGYITKPVSCQDLETTIMKHLSEEIMERR